jgi:hypothetical protein
MADEATAIQSQDSSSGANDTSSADDILDEVILEIDDYKGTKTFGGHQSVTEGMEPEEEEFSDTEPAAKAKPEKEVEKPSDLEEAEETSTIRHMRKTIGELQKKLKNIEQKQEAPEEKPEVQLTDEQLLGIMQEHEGDPQVLINVMKYLQQQGAKDAEKTAEATGKIKALQGQADQYLTTVFNGYKSEEFNTELDTHFPLEDWGLKHNPLGRQIQAGLALASAFKVVLDNELKKNSKNQTAGKERIEEKRQEAISKRGGLPKPEQMAGTHPAFGGKASQVIKDLGLSPAQQKLYATFLGGRKKG